MARNDSPAFIEKNSLAVCENMKIGLPDRRTIRLNSHVFFAGLTEFRLTAAVKGSPKSFVKLRWECETSQTHSRAINIIIIVVVEKIFHHSEMKKFDLTREKMFSCTCIDFLPNLHGSCLTGSEKVTF